uniref:NAC domain-containing protein n=1 Tax=Oryza nivara TaxID=4536 RepID=A0A0E0J2A1_ORYNI
MAGPGVCINLLNGTTMHLSVGCVFRPTEGELVVNYLYRRAMQEPLPCDFITDVDIQCHNPWDIVPAGEKKNGKHFFTRKENSHPRDYESNHAAGDGFWRLAGTEVPIYNKPSGGADEKLVGMKRTLVFHFRKSSSTERTGWVMQEFRLAGASLVPCLVMRPATGDVSMPPCGCTKTTTTKKNNGSPSAAHTHAPLVETMVEPDNSWMICRIYKKRQRAPQVIIPPSIGNAREAVLAVPAIGNAGDRQVTSLTSQGIDVSRRGVMSLPMSSQRTRAVMVIGRTNRRKKLGLV